MISCCRWLPLLLVTISCTTLAFSFAFDKDTGKDCQRRAMAEYCTKDPDTYFECPITCAHHLKPTESQASGGVSSKDQSFYDLEAKHVNGNSIGFERYEGYVTVVASVPLFQGLAQFYYEMLERLHDTFPYTLEIMLITLTGQDGIDINQHINGKVTRLDAVNDESHPVLRFLQNTARPGSHVDQTQATLYIISADGDFVEAYLSPTMLEFQKHLEYHLGRLSGQEL